MLCLQCFLLDISQIIFLSAISFLIFQKSLFEISSASAVLSYTAFNFFFMVCSFFPHRGYSLNCSSGLNSRGFIRSLMILLGSAAGSVSSSSISTSHRKSKWSLIILFISLTRWYSLDKAILYHLMVGEMIPEWHVAILLFISWGLGLSVLSLPLSISSTLHVWMRQNDTQHLKLHRCKRLHQCNEVESMQPLNHRKFGL